MNVTEIITQTMARTLNISATDADNTDTRARVLEGLIEVAGHIFNFRDWRFRRATSAALVFSGESAGDMPDDYLRIGDYGGVFLASTGQQLDAVTEQEMESLKNLPGASTSNPAAYAIYALNPISYAARINIPVASGNVTLNLAYETKLGLLDEVASSDGPPVVVGGVDNIKLIPEVWHQSVIMPGLRAMFRQQVGDGRYQDFRQDPGFRMGLKEMVKWERHGDETTRSLPSFFGS